MDFINIYGPYPSHLEIEHTAVQRSTISCSKRLSAKLLLLHYKLCLYTQIDRKDQFEIIPGTIILDDQTYWVQIKVYSQLVLIENQLQPLIGWIQGSIDILNPSFLDFPKGISFTKNILLIAQKYVGIPYTWGGKSRKETDCSGLIYQIYREQGKIIPRFANGQFKVCELIDPQELDIGDLIFNLHFGKPVHVMMYLGNELIIESSGLPEVSITRLITFQEKWNLPKSTIKNGFHLLESNTQLFFGRLF